MLFLFLSWEIRFLDRADLPEKPVKISVSELDDIPVAWRDGSQIEEKSSLSSLLWLKRGLLELVGIMLIILVSVVVTGLLSGREPLSNNSQSVELEEVEPEEVEPEEVEPSPPEIAEPENLLGHLSYQEVPESELKPITKDGRMRLRTAAAQKFLQMQSAARASGIFFRPISAFRSVSEQQSLFFAVKEQRGQVATKRAEVSAPPGYSEHHTGYAIDIGDAKNPGTDLSPGFARTAAFAWLEKNAAYYSFELSFPENNLQGVSYEPWHWRFVGDRHSLETFYKAKNLQQPIDKTR